jgi:hypothetical protein
MGVLNRQRCKVALSKTVVTIHYLLYFGCFGVLVFELGVLVFELGVLVFELGVWVFELGGVFGLLLFSLGVCICVIV